MQFTLKQAMIGIAAIAVPLSQGPPYVTVCCCSHEATIINTGFWTVAAAEVSLFAVVSLVRYADALRRDLDNAPHDNEPQP